MSGMAIETQYAGCRFRSRLEARWAVFFDEIGIEWHYEPEGFEIGLIDEVHTRRYLPDFYLPESQTWVEVKSKGNLDRELIAASVIPHCGGLPGSRLLLLHEIPKYAMSERAHWALLSFYKGDINCCYSYFESWGLVEPTEDNYVVGNDSSWTVDRWINEAFPHFMDHEIPAGFSIASAYKAARSARFEFGESGAAA
jgi:hypothetical protein